MTQKFDVVIIGGGASGMLAALTTKNNNPTWRVALIDQSTALGRKLLVTGAGRCNLTNSNLMSSPEQYYESTNPALVKNVFDKFDYQQTIKFFENLGVDLYEEKKAKLGKIFPVTDEARTVRDLLELELKNLGVDIFLNTRCSAIRRQKDWFDLRVGKDIWWADKVVIACGGKTYSKLGSDGSGYTLAHSLGHEIVDPLAVTVPLVSKNQLSQLLLGVRLPVEVKVLVNNKETKNAVGELLFTKYGLSGTVILNVSAVVAKLLKQQKQKSVELSLNFLPDSTVSEVKKILQSRFDLHPERTVEQNLLGLFSTKVSHVFVKLGGLVNQKSASITQSEFKKLVEIITDYRVSVTETRGFEEAEFTSGGIALSQVKPTLESKLVPGLYFCGEVLDVTGPIGGFNLAWAWSSGVVAGLLA